MKRMALFLFLILLFVTIGSVQVIWFSDFDKSIKEDVTAYGQNHEYTNPDRKGGIQDLITDVTVWGELNGG